MLLSLFAASPLSFAEADAQLSPLQQMGRSLSRSNELAKQVLEHDKAILAACDSTLEWIKKAKIRARRKGKVRQNG